MKSLSVLTLALGIGLALPASPDVHASLGGIQRCRAPDGSAVYTDKPCMTHNAKPEAISTELGLRLSNEALREPQAYIDNAGTGTIAPSGAVGRRSLQAGCARSPTQLAMDVQGSIAMHDVNRLAESWHWVGTSHKQATQLMRQLQSLADAKAASSRYFDAQIGFGLQLASNSDASAEDGRAGILQLQLAGTDGPRMLELNVERYAGCYFLRF